MSLGPGLPVGRMVRDPLNPHPPGEAVRDAVDRAVREDVLALGDLTASRSPSDRGRRSRRGSGGGVLAGEACARTFRADRPGCRRWTADPRHPARARGRDGHRPGPLARSSPQSAPRSTSSATCPGWRRYPSVRRRGHRRRPGDRIVDTRKTTPGLRALEKAAVRAGGGHNHRGSLSDAVLIKDNHLGGRSISEAVQRARGAWPGPHREVECDRLDQVSEAVGPAPTSSCSTT